MGRYLADMMGGDITPSQRASVGVKVVATGRGNEERGGGGACCTALAAEAAGPRPFFDVEHLDWVGKGQIDKVKIAAHEYAHGWQNTLGCFKFNLQPLGAWFNEGVAEYLAHESLIYAGLMGEDHVVESLLLNAKRSGELDVPLSTFDDPLIRDTWPGHAGALAVRELVEQAPDGLRSLRTVCQQVAGGDSIEVAFESAFGITRTAFHLVFEQVRDDLRGTDPEEPSPRRATGTGAVPSLGVDPAEQAVDVAAAAASGL